jgi:DNA-binding transcriptional LysR family regulator
MSDLLNLNRLIFFTTVVDTGSFTLAAERLGVAKAVVSHQVARLEQELGVTLLTRTTRRLHTTGEGRLFHERCVIILREAEAAYAEMSQRASEPSGMLTLTAPLDYGAAVVAPTIAAYRQRFPQMQVNVIFDDDVMDLVAGQVDLAIRVGWLADSSNQARRLGAFDQYLVATPSLIGTMPPILSPADATNLPWVANVALRNPLRWVFSHAEKEAVTIDVNCPVTTDKTPAAYACVLAGVGISVFPDYMATKDIEAGRLVRMLPDWSLPAGGIHAVFPPARFRPAKVRAFVDMLKAVERRRVAQTMVGFDSFADIV